jgi:acyl carrier protein
MNAPTERDRFIRETVRWLNEKIVPGGAIRADTALFADGLVNSIRILEILARVEQAIGRAIPDAEIRMDNFATVRRIADVFVSGGAREIP